MAIIQRILDEIGWDKDQWTRQALRRNWSGRMAFSVHWFRRYEQKSDFWRHVRILPRMCVRDAGFWWMDPGSRPAGLQNTKSVTLRSYTPSRMRTQRGFRRIIQGLYQQIGLATILLFSPDLGWANAWTSRVHITHTQPVHLITLCTSKHNFLGFRSVFHVDGV